VRDQLILRVKLQIDTVIRNKLYRAYCNIPEYNIALFRRSAIFQATFKNIRNSLIIRSQTGNPQIFAINLLEIISGRPISIFNGFEIYYTNRKYKNKSTRYSD
jgi:hypothetical protein